MNTYSHSRLNTFQNCPLKYKYQYIEKLKIEKRDSIEAFMGSRCHESLEKLYKHLLNRKLWTKDELLDDFKIRWEKNWHDNIYIVRKDYTQQNYYEQGIYSLEHYYDRYHPFDSDKTISIEQRVVLSLDDSGNYRLQGFIDRLSETEEGHYQIHDYKTERNFKSQEYFDQERQLALYQIGIGNIYNDIKSVELIWHYLLFDKEARSSRDDMQLERLKSDTIELIDRIELAASKNDFPYEVSALCDWCDYYSVCPAWKHEAVTEDLNPQEFVAEDGVRMVNRLVELRDALRQIKDEKSKLEEMLFEYCKQLGADIIRGSDNQIKVKQVPIYKAKHSLSKNPQDEERFLQFIKERGLFEELMVVNSGRLNKAMTGNKLGEEIKEALKEYVVLEEGNPRFSISKIREKSV